MSRRSSLLFHQHRGSVRCNANCGHTHSGPIASMFCKSCNCNSSIATRIGFAARIRNSPPHAQSNSFDLDHIHTQLPSGMAHGNTVRHTQDRRVELRLHQDGMRRRQMLWCTCGAYCLNTFIPLVSFPHTCARFIEFVLHYSSSIHC